MSQTCPPINLYSLPRLDYFDKPELFRLHSKYTQQAAKTTKLLVQTERIAELIKYR